MKPGAFAEEQKAVLQTDACTHCEEAVGAMSGRPHGCSDGATTTHEDGVV